MNHPHLPRALIILLFILVAGTTLVGSLRSFASAQAAEVIENSSLNGQSAAVAQAPTPTPTTKPSINSPTRASILTTPTPTATLAPTSTPVPEPIYVTDMTGIITLGILLVVVILVGVTWGGRRVPKKKE
jgi:hypothetical protein